MCSVIGYTRLKIHIELACQKMKCLWSTRYVSGKKVPIIVSSLNDMK